MASKKKAAAKKPAAKKAAFKAVAAGSVKELLKLKAKGALGRAKLEVDDDHPSGDVMVKLEIPTGKKTDLGDKEMHTVFEQTAQDVAREAMAALGFKFES